jgi:hypothetical protein
VPEDFHPHIKALSCKPLIDKDTKQPIKDSKGNWVKDLENTLRRDKADEYIKKNNLGEKGILTFTHV